MTKLQVIVVVSCVALFGILFFGFDTKPSSFKEVERTRALSSTSLDVNDLIFAAVDSLSEASKFEIATLDEQKSNAGSEEEKN